MPTIVNSTYDATIKNACGIERNFKCERDYKKFVMLHKKRCEICKNANNVIHNLDVYDKIETVNNTSQKEIANVLKFSRQLHD